MKKAVNGAFRITVSEKDPTKMTKQKLAVIGAGVAGITTALLLEDRFDVTLFEKNNYIGGHTNTVNVKQSDGSTVAVDTGFIVCNDRTYPNFHKLLKKLNTKWRYADMSFSVVDEKTGLQYGSKNINTIFADRRNIFSFQYYKFLVGIQRFWQIAKADLNNESVNSLSLQEYITLHSIPESVVQNFILPISAAIWSTPDKLMLDFPVGIFLKFYGNHGLLSVANQPRWQTVVGGSASYVKAFESQFKGIIKLNCGSLKVNRFQDYVEIINQQNQVEKFDYVVIATHADQVLSVIQNPSDMEQKLFSVWKYLNNDTILHTDESLLPSNLRARASWNYRRELQSDGSRPLSISYHMNNLQGLSTKDQYVVTLNSKTNISPDKVIARFDYTHPHFTVESMKTQNPIMQMNSENRTFFAGSYLRFGFHEDAVMSGVNIAKYFGVEF